MGRKCCESCEKMFVTFKEKVAGLWGEKSKIVKNRKTVKNREKSKIKILREFNPELLEGIKI